VKRVALLLPALALGLSAVAFAERGAKQQMAEIFEAMRFLLPLSLDEQQFSDPAQRDKIEQALALLARSGSLLEEHGRREEAGFSYLSRALAVDARDIRRRFEAGYVQETQFLVQQLTDTCIACHSLLPSKNARLIPRLAREETLERLPLEQRAKLAYATHRFEIALESYEALLASEHFSATDLDMMGYLDDYLELCIRVRGDLERPAAALEKFATRRDPSPALRDELTRWMASLRELARRKPARSALVEARALLEQTQDASRFQDERDALVYYLQASAALHRFLVRPPKAPADLAEAYYLLGMIETQVGKSFWLSQAEAYLEAAIRAAPRDPVALRAYDLLEEFLVAGYTGSAGTHVPPDIQARLDALRALTDEPQPTL